LKFLQAALLLGLVPWAWASDAWTEACDCTIQKAEFTPAPQAVRELALPVHILAATPKIEFLDRDGKVIDHCSAVMTSDAGHMYTAGHCVEACVEAGGAYQSGTEVKTVDKAKLAEVQCAVKINGAAATLSILAVSNCGRHERINLPREKCPGPEYAIVKTPFVASACLKQAAQIPEEGATMYSAGFPQASYRDVLNGSRKDSDGVNQFISAGQVLKANPECVRDGKTLKFPEGQQKKSLMQAVKDGDLMQTTVDILGGSSGGPSINGDGDITGLASMMIINHEVGECKGSTFFSPIKTIRDQVAKDYPELDLRATINCDKKSPRPSAAPVTDRA
jgi:hypothetical protein